MNIYRFLELDL